MQGSELPDAKATTIARSVDAGGRPVKQYEVRAAHAESVAERERGRGGRLLSEELALPLADGREK
jgi:hypothetical protein